jgi:hypothetical protein
MWTTIALLAVLPSLPNQAGTLKLDHVRSTHGILGPTRADENYVPGDALNLNFDIVGITIDDKGKILYSIAYEVTNLDDKSTVVSQAPQKLETLTAFGGKRAQGMVHLDIGTEQAPGNYSMKVTVTDRATGAAQELTHKFTIVKPRLALVRLRTSSDENGDFPVPALGEGQTLWFNFGIIGFARDASTKQPNLQLEFNVLDDAGKPTMAKPYVTTFSKEVPEKNLAIPQHFPLSLTRAGKFTIELGVTDLVTKKSEKLTFKLNVLNGQ